MRWLYSPTWGGRRPFLLTISGLASPDGEGQATESGLAARMARVGTTDRGASLSGNFDQHRLGQGARAGDLFVREARGRQSLAPHSCGHGAVRIKHLLAGELACKFETLLNSPRPSFAHKPHIFRYCCRQSWKPANASQNKVPRNWDKRSFCPPELVLLEACRRLGLSNQYARLRK
jgi:hypothetical protein